MVASQDSLAYRRPYLRTRDVFDKALLTEIFFDCDFSFFKLSLDQFSIENQRSSSFGFQPQNAPSRIVPVQMTKLVYFEAIVTVDHSTNSLIQSSASHSSWFAVLSQTTEMPSTYYPINLYNIKTQVLAYKMSKLFISASFHVPYPFFLAQGSTSDDYFICSKGIYLLLGVQGEPPQVTAAFNHISVPLEIDCSYHYLSFDVSDLKITSGFNDQCDSSQDSVFVNEQCSKYRSISWSQLKFGVPFTANVQIRRKPHYQQSSPDNRVNINLDENLFVFRVNLAQLSTADQFSPDGVLLDARDVEYKSQFCLLTF